MYNLAKLHRALLTADSRIGEGATFTFALDLPGNRVAPIEPDPSWTVNPSAECIAGLEAIWGRNAVSYAKRGDGVFGDPKRNRRRYIPRDAS